MQDILNYNYVINMIGAGNIQQEHLLEIYSNIPDSGLFNNIESEDNLNKALILFKKYCNYILEITKNEKLYQLLQKKFVTNMKINKTKEMKYILERLKMSNYSSIGMIETNINKILDKTIRKKLKKKLKIILKKFKYPELINELNIETRKRGEYYMKIGHDFEKQVSSNIIPKVAEQLNYDSNNLLLIENALLKLKKNNQIILIGEIDIIIIEKKSNHIIAVGEIKKSLDDVSDALFQINRTFNNIRNEDVFLESGDKIYPNNIFNYIKSIDETKLLQHSFIFSELEVNKKYKNIPSKLSLVLLQILWSGNISNISDKFYKKLFFRIKKKQKNRYITSTLNTIDLFKKNNLLQRIVLNQV